MTDQQILTLIIGITFPVLGILGAITAVLYSNKRIDDTNTNLARRLDDTNKRLDDLKTDLIRHMDNAFAHMELLLKLHEAEHHKKD